MIQRNVRRALAENPRHPAVRALQVDLLPITNAQESHWIGRNPNRTPRLNARALQRIAALQDAIVLAPENPNLHGELSQAYREMHLLDASLEQLELAIRGISDVDGTKAAQAIKVRDQRRAELDQRRADYELRAAGATPMNKVRFAMVEPYRIGDDNRDPQGRGLALEALRVLQSIDPANLAPPDRLGRTLELVRLNLMLGRIGEAAGALNKAQIDLQKAPPEIRQAMAESTELISMSTGWYKTLDKSIELIEEMRAGEVANIQLASARALIPNILSQAFSDRDPLAIRLTHRLELEVKSLEAREAWLRSQMFLGDVQTLRGIFLLEQGDAAAALRQFELATKADVPFADRRIAERYRDLIRRYGK